MTCISGCSETRLRIIAGLFDQKVWCNNGTDDMFGKWGWKWVSLRNHIVSSRRKLEVVLGRVELVSLSRDCLSKHQSCFLALLKFWLTPFFLSQIQNVFTDPANSWAISRSSPRSIPHSHHKRFGCKLQLARSQISSHCPNQPWSPFRNTGRRWSQSGSSELYERFYILERKCEEISRFYFSFGILLVRVPVSNFLARTGWECEAENFWRVGSWSWQVCFEKKICLCWWLNWTSQSPGIWRKGRGERSERPRSCSRIYGNPE